MNPSKKGWLSDFLEYRKRQFESDKDSKKEYPGQDPEQSFYGIVQPTGIMYGYAVTTLDSVDTTDWSDKDKVKVLLVNSLINVAELYSEKSADVEAFSQLMQNTLEMMCSFYESVYTDISISSTNWLGKKKDTLIVAERILEKRANMAVDDKSNFWLRFFHRSQLFLDIYVFGQWTYTRPDKVLQDFFKGEKDELSYNAVKVMAAAAHANKNIADEERSLFGHFIESSGMPTEKKRVAHEYFEHGLGIQDIPIDTADPWVLRKFFLELSILTIWSDKKVDETELIFLKEFSNSLGFSSEDLEKSMIAVEGFVLENWVHLEVLQDKKDYEELSQEYLERISTFTVKYRNRLFNEMKADRELSSLIIKGNAQTLNTGEKEVIRQHLIKILRGIPAFSLISLPDQFLTYEYMIKVYPKEAFAALNEMQA
ncbi:TerB family tellurite resistance protein [Fulvivirga sp. RKSG066]|uniref:tellurite resistance TerB family protein n=1 Tax=Fulvivirga aurantia TaxID=2529383 RepID=UPI0012BB77B3|nr:TerB family tellurite resistance protein [Fulvivirga aurantia]MTI23128.1 TerB family tellurite resistance protein [Fulvivirga aurantia]